MTLQHPPCYSKRELHDVTNVQLQYVAYPVRGWQVRQMSLLASGTSASASVSDLKQDTLS